MKNRFLLCALVASLVACSEDSGESNPGSSANGNSGANPNYGYWLN